MIRDTLEANIKTALWSISSKLDTLKDKLVTLNTAASGMGDYLKKIASKDYLKEVVGYLRNMATDLKSIATDIGNMGGYASGGIAWTPQLARVAEHGPEIIMPLRDYQAGSPAGIGEGANQQISLQNHIYIDGTEMKNFITKVVRERTKSELMLIHPKAVRAY
jgi:hypothetical protein